MEIRLIRFVEEVNQFVGLDEEGQAVILLAPLVTEARQAKAWMPHTNGKQFYIEDIERFGQPTTLGQLWEGAE